MAALQTWKFFAGLMAGVTVGAAATLLTTPREGRKVRERLARDAKRLTVWATGLHPREWRNLVVEETDRLSIESLNRIRAAGL